MGETTSTAARLPMGSTYAAGGGSKDWLWNIAKRALPPGASDASVLAYMKAIARANGMELDPRTNNPKSDAKVRSGKLILPDYAAPPAAELAAGKGELALYMHGPVVKELKTMLNARGAKLDATNDTYDEATKAAWDQFRADAGLPVRKDGVVTGSAFARLKQPAGDTVARTQEPATNAPPLPKPGETRVVYDHHQKKLVPVTTKGHSTDKGAVPNLRVRELQAQANFRVLDAPMRETVLRLAGSKDPAVIGAVDTIAKTDKYNRSDDRVKALVLRALQDPKNAHAVTQILNDERGTDGQLEQANRLLRDGRAAHAAENGKPIHAIEALEKDPRFARMADDQRNDVLRFLSRAPDAAARARIASLAVGSNFALLDRPARRAVLKMALENGPQQMALAELMAKTDLYNRTDDARVKAQVRELLKFDLNNAPAIMRVLKGMAAAGTEAQEAALKQIARG